MNVLSDWVALNIMGWVVVNPAVPGWLQKYDSGFFVEDWRPHEEGTGYIWMVVRKMREQLSDGTDGFNFNLNWQGHKGIKISIAQFHKIDTFIHGQGADNDPCIAILKASKEAYEQWMTGNYRTE